MKSANEKNGYQVRAGVCWVKATFEICMIEEGGVWQVGCPSYELDRRIKNEALVTF